MTGSTEDAEETEQAIAEEFGLAGPLAEYDSKFAELEADPFVPYINNVLEGWDDSTIRQYRSVFDEWVEFMEDKDRQPATPTKAHVKQFITWLLTDESDPRPHGRPNAPSTAKGKVRKLNDAYEYWQGNSKFPHPTDHNPFSIALKEKKQELRKMQREMEKKEEWRIPFPELREHLDGINHLRSLAIIATQLKLGLRAGEVVNLRIGDFSLEKTEVREHFPEMGSHPRLDGRLNAIYIAPRFERDGNKSRRPRVLPLDEEMQRVLLRYLLIRPDNGEPWLFLSQKSHSQLTPKRVNEVWKKEFRPEYGETDLYKPVRSHYGRHRFTTYWRINQDTNSELVGYMRGDKEGSGDVSNPSAMDDYLHTYYPDIEQIYRERIFRLGL